MQIWKSWTEVDAMMQPGSQARSLLTSLLTLLAFVTRHCFSFLLLCASVCIRLCGFVVCTFFSCVTCETERLGGNSEHCACVGLHSFVWLCSLYFLFKCDV